MLNPNRLLSTVTLLTSRALAHGVFNSVQKTLIIPQGAILYKWSSPSQQTNILKGTFLNTLFWSSPSPLYLRRKKKRRRFSSAIVSLWLFPPWTEQTEVWSKGPVAGGEHFWQASAAADVLHAKLPCAGQHQHGHHRRWRHGWHSASLSLCELTLSSVFSPVSPLSAVDVFLCTISRALFFSFSFFLSSFCLVFSCFFSFLSFFFSS